MKRLLVLLCAILIAWGLFGQGNRFLLPDSNNGQRVKKLRSFPEHEHRFYLNIGGGFALPKPSFRGEGLGEFMTPEPATAGWFDAYDFMWFPTSHWGLSLGFRMTSGIDAATRRDNVFGFAKISVGDQFEVDNSRTRYDDSPFEPINWLRTGLCYRIEKDGFVLMPRLQASIFFVEPIKENFLVKERESNRWFRLEYESVSEKGAGFSVSPGFWIGKTLNPRFVLHAQVNYDWPLLRIGYTETFTNILTQESNIQSFNEQKRLHGLFLGLGITYRMETLYWVRF
ncbi:MAG: hypothetical protein AB8F95_03845 [Bacteroidia bacterium]